MHLVALKDIEEGEELSMAYVDVSQHPDETPADAYKRRRAELAQGWKFACACPKCEEDKQPLELATEEGPELTDGSKVDQALEAHNLI